ncbi:GmrSD restriction endonuclease domain-containing protein [Streptomyces microflavus]|uniref:GmrSD restriction endonuclease domain-containing protein n=1 Tax=Streptomyces microflavus TaxID=1919 RepID=UPI00369808C0
MPPLLKLVDTLPVKAEAAVRPYSREAFGYDSSRMRPVVFREELRRDGTWVSPWDGRVYRDRKGMDVDHNVALKEAWDSGASSWPTERLKKFGADPANLNAITSSLNASKSDQDGRWKPAVGRCDYVEQVAEVKAQYGLSIDPAEKEAMVAVAKNCKG